MLKKNVAIIPARGNSKRINKKNLYPILKKPLLWYSIKQALAAKNIIDVFVSSDDDEIIAYAQSLNCKTIRRPSEMSSDTSTSEEALIHAIQFIEKNYYIIDSIMLLQCTSPVRKSKDIDDAIEYFYKEQADSLISVILHHRFVWQLNNGEMQSLNYDYHNRPRSQDVSPQFIETGSFYITNKNLLLTENNRLGKKIIPYVMNFLTNFEIDTIDDIAIVEWALKKYNV